MGNAPIVASRVTRGEWSKYTGQLPLRAGLDGSLMLIGVEADGGRQGATVKAIKLHEEGVVLQAAQVYAYDGVAMKTKELLGRDRCGGAGEPGACCVGRWQRVGARGRECYGNG